MALTRRELLISGLYGVGAMIGRDFLSGAEVLARNLEKLSEEAEPRSLESTVLMYHQMSATGLKGDIFNYLNRGYQPISIETLVAFFKGSIEIPPNLSTFIVTCDDGLVSQYDAVLKATGDIESQTGWFVPVIFFTMTKFDDRWPVKDISDDTPSYNDGVHRYMTKGQLIDLIRSGHRVENHTINHGYLPRLSEGARNDEVIRGEERNQALWDLAGAKKRYRAFAYPYGAYSGQVETVKGIYDVAFSTIPTTTHSTSTLYIMGRMGRS